MIDIQRWNHETQQYEPYTPNPEWALELFTPNMDLPINCTNCGKDMTYGEGYTSRELHTHHGLGWPVCENCHQEEFKREGLIS